MKLKYEFVTNEVADKIVAVAVGEDLDNFNGFLKMNDISAFMFDLLKNDVTEDDIVKAMIEKYPNEAESEIKETVSGFVAQLKENDLLA